MNARSRDPVVVSMATIPRRVRSLKRAVASLLPQCDRLNVYLNGYRRVPDFLRAEKVHVASSSTHGNRGDAGKFWWSDKLGEGAYHITVDDDILYPRDYCRTLIAKIEQFGRHAVVGVHGVVIPGTVGAEYYGARRVYPCFSSLPRSRAVHLLGTGTVAYHTSTLAVDPTDFRRANMADVWFGILAKRQRVPMICVRRREGWLIDLGDPDPSKTICATHHRHNSVQAAVLRAENPWPPPLTIPPVKKGSLKRATPRSADGSLRLVRANPNSGREFGARKVDAKPVSSGVSRNSGVRIKR